MTTKSDVLWFGVDGLENLELILDTGAAQAHQLGSLDADHRWQKLADAVASGWPGRPGSLDATAVLRRLGELAAQVTRRLPSVRQQVIDDAPGVIALAFDNFQPGRPFNPWARTVLHNHAVSLHRRERRMRADTHYLDTLVSPLVSLAEDDLAEVVGDFRRLCDLARFPQRSADGPELAAVFALEVRLRLLNELVRLGPDFLDDHLPLRHWERALQIQRGWPMLGELWGWLANSVVPGQRNIVAIRRACGVLAPAAPVAEIHKVWNTWLARAKHAVRHQLESHVQALLFFHLFPDHRAVEVKAGSDGLEHRLEAF